MFALEWDIDYFARIPIDSKPHSLDNSSMSTDTSKPLSTDAKLLEDLISKLRRGERDPEAAEKARERMDRMREETYKRVGLLNVAVPYIRELRDR